MSAKIGTENRDLVICNNCQWAVSLLKGSQAFDCCPVCNSRTLEVIPVEDYGSYKLDIRGKRSLSGEFTEDSLRPDL